MERLTIPFNGGYLFKLPPKDDEKAQEEFFEELSNRLGAYEDAEEQGLILRLPCKVGDRTYQVVTRYEKLNKYGCTCCTTECGSNCDCAYYDDGCTNPTAKDEYQIISRGFKLEDYWGFGKTVFLTKEEAEQKLESMKKGES